MGEVVQLKDSLDQALSAIAERIKSGEIKTALLVYVDSKDDTGIIGLAVSDEHYRYLLGILDEAKDLIKGYLDGPYEVEEQDGW